MKISHLLLLSLSSFLSFASTVVSNPTPSLSDGLTPSPVLDADGGELRAGVNYFVLPATQGGGGGGLLSVNLKQKSFCPRDIIQDTSEVRTGLPVVFSPVDSKTGPVPLSTDLNVKFFTSTVCSNETVWRVGEYDELLDRYFIVTGGVEGNPGPETVSNWFRIEKIGSDYKFVFCPSVCSMCRVVCKDVGIYVGTGGIRFLSLSDTPFVVNFESTFPVYHGPPPPVPVPHEPPSPVHEPPPPVHEPPPPVPVPHGPPPPPPPVPVPHGPPPPAPVHPGPPPPDASSGFATLNSVFYVIIVVLPFSFLFSG